MEEIILVQEKPEDYTAVLDLHRQAFGQVEESHLVEALRRNPAVFIPELSLLAKKGDKVLGHILITRIQIVGPSGKTHESLALAPMAVLPEMQNKGIGSKLVRKVLEISAGLGFQSMIVLGHAAYYPRFGFKPAIQWNIKAPFEIESNLFMAIELIQDGLKSIQGTVVYPAEFGI